MLVQIVLASALLVGGDKVELYNSTDKCNYGYRNGALLNRNRDTLVQICWALRKTDGFIVTDTLGEFSIESLDLTREGRTELRKELR